MIEVEWMKIIPTSEVNEERLMYFLECNEEIDASSLLKSGYVVECNKEIIGCFELQLIEEGVYWLKQLYIIQHEVGKLPGLLEFILLFAKKQNAKVIYAHSEQPVTDLLLESLSFSLQPKQSFLLKEMNRKGHWWTYQVS